MTVPALAWEQTGTIPQRTTRMAQGGLLGRPTAAFTSAEQPTTGGGAHGVVGAGDFLCSGTTLTIAVAAGGAFISGANAAQGNYYGYNDASQNVVLGAHNTNPRIDLIVLRARDNAEDSSGATSLSLESIPGTPAASPAAPAVPNGTLVLARVNIPANSGATTVTDRRPFAAALGGVYRCNSTLRPTGAALYEGLHIYELNTKRVWVWDGANWVRGAWLAAAGRTGLSVTGSTQSFPNASLTSTTFDVETFDSDGFISVPSTVATVPAGCDGLYTITARVNLTSACGGAVEISAGAVQYDFSFTSPVLAPAASVAGIPLAAGATIVLGVYQALGSAQNANVRLDAYRMGR